MQSKPTTQMTRQTNLGVGRDLGPAAVPRPDRPSEFPARTKVRPYRSPHFYR
jgi:hypothetical protein